MLQLKSDCIQNQQRDGFEDAALELRFDSEAEVGDGRDAERVVMI